MRVALDTNVLAYVEGVNGESRKRPAIDLVQGLAKTLVPAQALGELYNVLVRKSGWSGDRARAAIMTWREPFRWRRPRCRSQVRHLGQPDACRRG